MERGKETAKGKETKEKGKKWQTDVVQESFKDVIGHVIEVQKISDKTCVELEEKHMRLEEAQHKGKWKWRDKHEFQIRVLQMLSGYAPPMHYGGPASYYNDNSQI